ncbi:hypothetical protein NNL26_03250 [Micrococcus luteus]|uniref:hypothetical protein n=1 Tax=Micrococcus luteus TaxID=1270 RepID=UPI002103E92A|nr:hypothetical protein [Micrococcus luteus]UTX35273.1 hypothetical protein NNL26_03250 [Micrococcus luteus]
MKKLAPAAVAALALALTSCASTDSQPAASSSSASSTAAASSASGLADAVSAALADDPHVTGVESPEDGRVEVSTDLTDPRTDNSAEAGQAVAICEAAAEVQGVEYVNVTEADGTSWVLFGHPKYPEGECTEV